jgi:catechol 2,3-dioxygenase-like lactoylglutathione lyase family enzyme
MGPASALGGARIFHVNVNCSDLARSRDFYVQGCGLAEGVRTAPEQAQSGTAFGLDRARWEAWILVGPNGFDGGAIDLLEWQEPSPAGAAPKALNDAGFQRLGVTVADLDATMANVAAHGGDVWGEPVIHHLPNGGEVRILFASDPDGVAVEVVEGAKPGLSFVSVACADLERSAAFYSGLGFVERARFPSSSESGTHLRISGAVAMHEVFMTAPGGGDVNLMLVGFDQPAVQPAQPRPANALGMWRCALLVPDLALAVGELRAASIDLLSEPQTMAMGPGLPELNFVCLRGPDYEVIELIEQPLSG